MGRGKIGSGGSRRSFLKSGGAFLTGGMLLGAPGLVSPTPKEPSAEPPALPWEWVALDPMEAGTRAYHTYLNAGG